MWGSSAPPCQHPHPGSEVAGCHFQRLHRASHSFPRKQEEDFQGGASGDRSSSPTCYPSNQNPPAPHRLRWRRRPKGKVGLRQGLKGAPSFLGRGPFSSAAAHLSPHSFPSLSALDLRGSHIQLPPALFSPPWASRRYC